MSEVCCFYQWSEKKAQQLVSWVQAHDERYAIFLEESPSTVVLTTPHPRIRCISLPQQNPEKAFEKIAWEFLYLPFSFEDPTHPVLQKLAAVQSEINFRAFDFADQGLQLLHNLRSHLSRPTSWAKDLYGKFKNIPAIVCGGGPSLASASSELKRLQDRAVIIGCGAGVEALLKMGIKPHFAAHVDPAPCHKFSSADIPVFYELRTDAAVVEKYKGKRFLVAGPGNFPLESWVQEKLGLESVLDGGWTVGTFGVVLATLLGCESIVLAGMDLATSKGQMYSPGVKTTSTTDHFIPLKNREGEPVLSRADWVKAAQWLDAFALCHPDRKWGTISRKGLEIPSIPLMDLQEFQAAAVVTNRVQHAVQEAFVHPAPALWEEIVLSFKKSLEICRKILQEMERIFPQNPAENGLCAMLEHDLTLEPAFEQVLGPLWSYWLHVISRHNTAGEWGLYLNRILFFQSLCEKIDAI
ncbi:MAG: DUF115 domain-containing protein [Verrucomicrobia bacterium]|nr:DUF115 domain-containing protein [Verrucomicrobiota bacterium]